MLQAIVSLSVLIYMLQYVELMVKPMATSVKWSVMLVNKWVKMYRVKNVCKWITMVNVVSIDKLSIVLIIQ